MSKKVVFTNDPADVIGSGGSVSSASPEVLRNSLTGLFTGLAYGVPTGYNQLSQVDTFFKNNRWYFISNMRQILSEMYVEHGLIQTLVDVPVEDAFRGGIDVKTAQLSEDEVKKLKAFVKNNSFLLKLNQAVKWARLFGGGALIIITEQDPKTPLTDLQEGDRLDFKPCDLWELYGDITNPKLMDAVYYGDYETTPLEKYPEYYMYYGVKIHKSRVLRIKGLEAPSLVRPRLRGWGFSVIESVIRSYNQYLKSNNVAFEVIDEFKVGVYTIEGLNNSLATTSGTDRIIKRIELANLLKNYQSSIVQDKNDSFENKQLQYTGLSEIMREIRIAIASDLRMPLTKLFGMSANGFNSGEDDIENYNSMIESTIRGRVELDVLKMVELCCATLFGVIPDDLEISFAPLRELSATQQEEVKNQKMSRITMAMQAGMITPLEAKQSINRENLLPVKINEDEELFRTPEQQQAAAVMEEYVPNTSKKMQNSKQDESWLGRFISKLRK